MLEERVEPLTVEVAPRAAHLSVGLCLLQGVVVVEKVEDQLVPIGGGGGGGGVRPGRRKDACTSGKSKGRRRGV